MIRPIAIYLPQYHPVPENDLWWGKGFTEWTNVVKAKPLYNGHYQPQLPSDLGFCDLRLAETREAQAQMAKAFGVHGFCYYHYWFNGRRILERPFREVLELGQPDFPFMLCWANENWTRRWDGMENEVLLKQDYSDLDDVEHIRYLIKSVFADKRYIRIDGKPCFVIYKPFLLPNPVKTAQTWRQIAKEHGMELYLMHMVFGYRASVEHSLVEGFDAAIDFEPFGIRRMQPKTPNKKSLAEKILQQIKFRLRKFSVKGRLPLVSYENMFKNLASVHSYNFKLYPSLVPGWDNSPRRPKDPTLILTESTPEKFGQWFAKIHEDFKPFSNEENLVFINAWNEWAEGNHLEPCVKWGTSYLEATAKILLSEKVNL